MEVSIWLERLHTDNTREAYEMWLDRFLNFSGCTAEETLTWDVDKAEFQMLAFKDHLVKEVSGQSVHQAFAAVKKWFTDNRIKVDVKCRGVRKTKTYLDYIPVKEDVKEVLEVSTDLRYKVAESLIAFAGMRPVDTRELKYENIKRSYEARDKILTIQIRQEKTGEWYVTFLGPQGLGYLERLLEERQKKGEKITDDSYIVSDDGKKITRVALMKYLRSAIKRSVSRHPTGESFRLFRPYGLRKYFRRVARKLGEDTAEFLMGHVKGIESLTATYTGLKDLDPVAIEEIKKDYAKILPELETELSEETVSSELESLRRRVQEMERFKRVVLELDSEALTKFMREAYKDQRHRALLEDKEVRRQEREELETETNGGRQAQKVIDEAKVEQYLNAGWRYVGSLNGSRVIVERA